MIRIKLFILTVFSVLILDSRAKAQSTGQVDPEHAIIQFSGLVVTGDSAYGVPGVYLYNPKNGRGTITNYVGYFSMPVKHGDTIVIRALGFQAKEIPIPTDSIEKFTSIVQLTEDTTILPALAFTNFPSEREFKHAFLDQKIPEQEINNMYNNLNDQVMARLLVDLELDGGETAKILFKQQVIALENRSGVRPITLLDPFAWRRFIKDMKEWKKKKKEEKDKQRNY